MSMFAGLAAAGIGSSLIGGLLGSNAAKSSAQAEIAAAREARQLKVDKDAESQFFADVSMFGKDAAIKRLQARYGPDAAKYLGEKAADPTFNDQQRARVAELDQLIANGGRVAAGGAAGALPWSQSNKDTNSATSVAERLKSAKAERDALVKAAGGRIGTTGTLNVDAVDNAPGILQRLGLLTQEREADNTSLLADARQIESGLDAYGASEEQRIRRDAERALIGANRLSRASLMGRGLGAGTAYSGAIERNTRSVSETMGDQLGALSDNKIRLKTAAAGDTLNLRRGLMDNLYQYKSQPINTELQYATGAIQNPWQGVNTTQYVSAASPSGAAGATWGNLFSGMGGQAANLGAMGIMAQDPNFRALMGAG